MLCEEKVRKNSDNGKIEGFTHSFMNYALNMIALPNKAPYLASRKKTTPCEETENF